MVAEVGLSFHLQEEGRVQAKHIHTYRQIDAHTQADPHTNRYYLISKPKYPISTVKRKSYEKGKGLMIPLTKIKNT